MQTVRTGVKLCLNVRSWSMEMYSHHGIKWDFRRTSIYDMLVEGTAFASHKQKVSYCIWNPEDSRRKPNIHDCSKGRCATVGGKLVDVIQAVWRTQDASMRSPFRRLLTNGHRILGPDSASILWLMMRISLHGR